MTPLRLTKEQFAALGIDKPDQAPKPKAPRRKERKIGDGENTCLCPTTVNRKCPRCGYVAAGKGKHVHAGESIRIARAEAESKLSQHTEEDHADR